MAGLVRVSTVQQSYCPPLCPSRTKNDIMAKVRRNVAHLGELLDRAGTEGADIVSSPEDAGSINVWQMAGDGGKVFRSLVKDNYELVMAEVTSAARRHGMYVVACAYEEVEGKVYNAGILVDRTGAIVGKYRKTHLAPTERLLAIAPGNDYPVFPTEFGNIGILICYDMMFPEAFRAMSLNGADVIFNPTYGFAFCGEDVGQIRVQARALDSSVYLVVSNYANETASVPGCSQIIGPDGRVIARGGYEPDIIVSAVVDVSLAPIQETDSEETGVPNLRARFLMDRRPDTYQVLVDRDPPLGERYRGMHRADLATAEKVFMRRAEEGRWFERGPDPRP